MGSSRTSSSGDEDEHPGGRRNAWRVGAVAHRHQSPRVARATGTWLDCPLAPAHDPTRARRTAIHPRRKARPGVAVEMTDLDDRPRPASPSAASTSRERATKGLARLTSQGLHVAGSSGGMEHVMVQFAVARDFQGMPFCFNVSTPVAREYPRADAADG